MYVYSVAVLAQDGEATTDRRPPLWAEGPAAPDMDDCYKQCAAPNAVVPSWKAGGGFGPFCQPCETKVTTEGPACSPVLGGRPGLVTRSLRHRMEAHGPASQDSIGTSAAAAASTMAGRTRCTCLCGCRKRPGRRVCCDWCEQMVGPGCCLAYEALFQAYCHVCGPPPPPGLSELGGTRSSMAGGERHDVNAPSGL